MRVGLALLLLVLCACKGPSRSGPSATTTSAPAPEPAASSKPNTWPAGKALTVLTYNVLATPIYRELRTQAVLDVLKRSDAHIIALQEVDAWFLEALVAAPWVRALYHLSQDGGRPFAPGGQLIMAKQPLQSVSAMEMPGRQHRILLIAELLVGGRLLAVATTHMESFLKDGPTRAKQLEGSFALLKAADDALFLGDLNFGDGAQPETKSLDPAYVDLWSLLRPGEPGFTWNMLENPLARIGAFSGEPDRRLDRILLRSSAWQAKSVAIIGNRPTGRRTLTSEQRAMIEMPDRRSPDAPTVDIDVFPSDHYGLVATLLPN